MWILAINQLIVTQAAYGLWHSAGISRE